MPLILHDDLLALGTALGANIGRLEQTVRFAQPLRTLQPLRRAVLGRPVHPVDAMGTLQGPFLHFTAAIWTNHALALSVPEGLRLPGTPIMFGRTRACRTFPDSASSVPEGLRLSGTPMPAPLGAAPPPCGGEGGIGSAVPPRAARRVRIQGGCNPPWKDFSTSARPSRARDGLRKRPGSPGARTPPCHPRATRSRSRRSWSWAAP